MAENMTKLTAGQRQARICQTLKEKQEISIVQLAERFGVSEMTVRRDLDKLENVGQIRRTHGGAVPTERMVFEFDFSGRRQAYRKEKQAIAAEAVKLIQPGHRLLLDTGTTTLELAYLLKEFSNLTVVTPSLAVASVLQFSPGVGVVLLGGIILKGSCDLTGVVTESNLDMFAVDIAFQGADGIGLDGTVYNADMRIAKVDQKMRRRAEHTYILSDSSKIGKTALATNGFIYDVDALIIDDGIDPECKKKFENIGAIVITVNYQKGV